MEEKKNNTKNAENKDSRKITLEQFEKAIFEFSKVDTKELMDGMQKILDELEEENKDK